MFSWAVVRRPVSCWPRWCWTPFSIRPYSTSVHGDSELAVHFTLRCDTSWDLPSSRARLAELSRAPLQGQRRPLCSFLQFLMQYSHNLSLSCLPVGGLACEYHHHRTAVWTSTTDSSPSCCSSNTWCGSPPRRLVSPQEDGWDFCPAFFFPPLIIHQKMYETAQISCFVYQFTMTLI